MVEALSRFLDSLGNALVFVFGNVLPGKVKELYFKDEGGATWDFGRAAHVAIGVSGGDGEHSNLQSIRIS